MNCGCASPTFSTRKARAALHLRLFRYSVETNPKKALQHLEESAKLDPSRFRMHLYRLLLRFGGPKALPIWFRIEKILKQDISLMSFQRRR